MNGHNAEKVVLMTRAGAHVDAPAHFFDEAPATDAIPLDAFAGMATFIDTRHEPEGAPSTGTVSPPSNERGATSLRAGG